VKKIFVAIWFILSALSLFSQDTAVFVQIKHKNGKVASEGFIRQGKPDGYWKTYNDAGHIVSEGNRKNFLLDSTWIFYNNGKHSAEINYKIGKKNGISKNYSDKEIVETPYIDDAINGVQYIYFHSGQIKKTTPFEKNLENGRSFEYDEEGTIIGITDFKKGFISSRQKFNRKDNQGLKQGSWKFFYPDLIVKEEGDFLNDKRNGWFKSYDSLGNLVSVDKYVNGDLEMLEQENLSSIEVKSTYFPNGQQRLVASYKHGVLEGVAREYDQDGNLIKGVVFKDGKPVSSGIVDNRGQFQGQWKENYEDGRLKAEGKYKNGKKIGEWKYYFNSGELEQVGNYDNSGKIDGEWTWYYKSGNTHIVQDFFEDLPEGDYIEYDESGNIIAKGQYSEGEKTGSWLEMAGDEISEGSYRYGEMQGKWKTYSAKNKKKIISVIGYFEGNLNGKYQYYQENGKILEEGSFLMGKHIGTWKKYDEQGNVQVEVRYKDDEEIRYDGEKTETKPLRIKN
jgi:antitoxin component YwqK of YwqJK toxin-antitoxin module